MQTGCSVDTRRSEDFKKFLESNLTPRGTDSVTAASDLCAHVNIAPQLRDAALKLVGADLYKKVKAPGDTSLYSNPAWMLESVATAGPSAVQGAAAAVPCPDAAQLAAAFTLPPGQYVLPETAKGQRVTPP